MSENGTWTRWTGLLPVIESNASRECGRSRSVPVKKQAKFGIGIGVIVVSMGFLAWLGYGESKTYYHTIAELQTLNGSAKSQRMRIGGSVATGRSRHVAGRVDFVLEGEGKALQVSYVGSD